MSGPAHPELRPIPVDAARYPSLAGRAVLVTGGGSGIGAELVRAFAGQGARVGFVDIDAEAAEATADAVAAETGLRPRWRPIDLRDIAALEAALEALRDEVGPFAALVNNAGNDDRKAAEDVTPEYWDDRFAVNLRHQFFAIRALLPDFDARGGGAVVNMGSNSWMQGAPGLIAYTTAKSAVQGMTRSLARELGGRRVRVNSIAPGWILTER